MAIVVCAGLALVACSRDEKGSTATTAGTSATSAGSTTAGTGDSAGGVSFGDLENVCQPGDAHTATAQGVTETEISVSVFSDIGFTKKTEYPDAAEVFTNWCNDHGGINGRKLVFNVRDARLTEDRQRMLEACREDFAVVGGDAAFDNVGVKERLKCLMPEIPAQTVSDANTGSDLQVTTFDKPADASAYEGYFGWLINEVSPASKDAIGIIAGDTGVTQVMLAQHKETLEAIGGKVTYTELYPAAGASDWTPYAQSIKDGNVKGLIFVGAWADLVKLEQALSDIGYTPDWIDGNSNAYNAAFLEQAGTLLDQQHTYAPTAIYPLENAADNPATQELVDIYAQYKPDAPLGMTSVRSFSTFLLFALAARDCGDQLTRKCMYENALKYPAWTGGGLAAPLDTGSHAVFAQECWTAVLGSSTGWTVPDVKPDTGIFRCTPITHRWTGDYTKPATLEDVGKTMDDFV